MATASPALKSQSVVSLEGMVARDLDTPLGKMVAFGTPSGVCLVEFVDRRSLSSERDELERLRGEVQSKGKNKHLDQLAKELDGYFARKIKRFSVKLDTPGSPFEHKVWARLLTIPYGKTLSYGQLAQDMGAPGGSRAVGRANGRNRVAIVIPCHRVVNADGSLGGYGGKQWRKRWLLDLEAGREPTITESAD